MARRVATPTLILRPTGATALGMAELVMTDNPYRVDWESMGRDTPVCQHESHECCVLCCQNCRNENEFLADDELPGMWERADFEGGRNVERVNKATRVILFKPNGKYYTEESWEIPTNASHPADMRRSKDYRSISGGPVYVSEDEWGYPHLLIQEGPVT